MMFSKMPERKPYLTDVVEQIDRQKLILCAIWLNPLVICLYRQKYWSSAREIFENILTDRGQTDNLAVFQVL